MPLESIVVSCLVIAVFGLFGVTLAYGEYQTRHLKHLPKSDGAVAARPTEDRWLEAA